MQKKKIKRGSEATLGIPRVCPPTEGYPTHSVIRRWSSQDSEFNRLWSWKDSRIMIVERIVDIENVWWTRRPIILCEQYSQDVEHWSKNCSDNSWNPLSRKRFLRMNGCPAPFLELRRFQWAKKINNLWVIWSRREVVHLVSAWLSDSGG